MGKDIRGALTASRGALARELSAGGTEVGHSRADLVAGDSFTTLDLGHAFGEALVEAGDLFGGPGWFGFGEVEGAVDDLGGLAVVAEVDLAPDALFGWASRVRARVGL